MTDFEPSLYSAPASSPEGYSRARDNVIGAFASQLISAGVGAAGAITATSIGASSSKRTQAKQHEHEQALFEQQEELIKLQLEATRGEADALRAHSATLGAGGTQKTTLVVGGVLLAVAMLAAALLVRSRAEDEYEEDYK